MLYWDTSALFAFLITEKHSAKLRALVQQQGSSTAYTAIITHLEFESAIQRRLSGRTLTLREADRARLFGVDFRKQAFLVLLDQNALDNGLHLQKIYGLRPGERHPTCVRSLGTDNPSRVVFLCLDEKLTQAAKREGFQTGAEQSPGTPPPARHGPLPRY